MAVKIGSARISEKGTINGKPGDQKNGMEVSTQNWYNHKKGWYILRAKDPKKAELIARNMEAFCSNDHFGYGQSDRSTAYTACKAVGWDASKVKKDCNTDCSMTVRICCLYADITAGPFSTLSEVDVLKKTGAFEVITDDKICSDPEYWKRGDIGVTRTKGHTVVALTSGSKAITPIGENSTAAGKITKLQTVTQKKDPSLKGKWIVSATTGAELRYGAGASRYETQGNLPKGTKVNCYGYYELDEKGDKWLYVTYGKKVGFVSKSILKK